VAVQKSQKSKSKKNANFFKSLVKFNKILFYSKKKKKTIKDDIKKNF
jgi:hypothetical protein